MLGIIVLSSIGAIVITTVFVGLVWAAIQDGRHHARMCPTVAEPVAPVIVTAPSAVPRAAAALRLTPAV